MSNSEEPKVSVIIPTFKRSDYLIRAIDSVLNNIYENVQVIVVDDNFPSLNFRHKTEFEMMKYQNNSKVIYIKNSTNLGGSMSRNIGIQEASGDYITFLDDDDIYLPDKICSQVRFMKEHDYDMCFTDLRLHDTSDKLIDYREFSFIKDFSNERLMRYHLTRHITGTPTFMYKRDCINQIGGFIEAEVGQEFYLMLNTIQSGAKIGYLSKAYVVAYLHPYEKISTGINKIEGEKALFAYKKTYFTLLTLREKIFVRFRYHVVMAVVGLRNKNKLTVFFHTVIAICLSPLDALIESLKFLYKARMRTYL